MATGETPRENDPRQDGAVFAPTALRARGRPPVVALVAVALVGGLVLLGALQDPDGERAAVATASAPAPAAATTRPPRTARPAPPRTAEPGPPALLVLELRPAGSHLFVHGDVFSTAVVNVVVSLEDSAGSVVDSRSASVPGGSTAFRLGPNPRFDVRFDVPDELMADGLWIRANAFNAGGTPIGTAREPVVPPRVVPV